MKHRLLALLLAACTLLCLVLTSCSKSTDSNQNDSADAATQDTQQAESSGKNAFASGFAFLSAEFHSCKNSRYTRFCGSTGALRGNQRR